jgi:hypothetical protein
MTMLCHGDQAEQALSRPRSGRRGAAWDRQWPRKQLRPALVTQRLHDVSVWLPLQVSRTRTRRRCRRGRPSPRWNLKQNEFDVLTSSLETRNLNREQKVYEHVDQTLDLELEIVCQKCTRGHVSKSQSGHCDGEILEARARARDLQVQVKPGAGAESDSETQPGKCPSPSRRQHADEPELEVNIQPLET